MHQSRAVSGDVSSDDFFEFRFFEHVLTDLLKLSIGQFLHSFLHSIHPDRQKVSNDSRKRLGESGLEEQLEQPVRVVFQRDRCPESRRVGRSEEERVCEGVETAETTEQFQRSDQIRECLTGVGCEVWADVVETVRVGNWVYEVPGRFKFFEKFEI